MRCEAFLAQTETLVPWAELGALIEPLCTTAANGRLPVSLQRMLRIYQLPHWSNLADKARKEALYHAAVLRARVGMDLDPAPVPHAISPLRFRHLLEKQWLDQAIFAEVGRLPQTKDLRLSGDTIVDATLSAAPGST